MGSLAANLESGRKIRVSIAIPDTGCSSSMMTSGRYKLVRGESQKKAAALGRLYSERVLETPETSYRVANGEVASVIKRVELPVVGLGPTHFSIIEPEEILTPVLIGNDCLSGKPAQAGNGGFIQLSNRKKVPICMEGGVPTVRIWDGDSGTAAEEVESVLRAIQTGEIYYSTTYGSITHLTRSLEQKKKDSKKRDREPRDVVFFVSEPQDEMSAGGLPNPDIAEVARDPSLARKLHHDTYHFGAHQLLGRYGYLTPVGSEVRAEFFRLAEMIVSTCDVCRNRDKPRPHPKSHGSGLRARSVSQIVALDTVEVTVDGKKRKVLHGMDVFSRFSLAIYSDGAGEDAATWLNLWTFIFGRAPKVLVADSGSESENSSVRARRRAEFTEFYHTPVCAPQSNGIVERGDGVLEIWLGKVQQNDGARKMSRVSDEDILLVSLAAKNATTKRFGVDARTLALGYPDIDSATDMLTMEDIEGDVESTTQQRLHLRREVAKKIRSAEVAQDTEAQLRAQTHSYTSASIEIGDRVEVSVPVKNKLRAKRRWQRAVVRGTKGNKILTAELSETGAYAEVRRENARFLCGFSKDHDRIVCAEKLNRDLGEDPDKTLEDKSKLLDKTRNLTTTEQAVVSSLVRQNSFLRNATGARTSLISPAAALMRGGELIAPEYLDHTREVTICRPRRAALTRSTMGEKGLQVRSRVAIGFGPH